jgi:2,3-bisphosphoglycerate-independent phosphoglycerate mutase
LNYIVVIGDGMADYPVKELGGKTPLQVARHPTIDRLASRGVIGTLRTIPLGMESNTDVALLSILGLNPRLYHTGRGPLEAISMGLNLDKRDVALRVNLITEQNGVIKDYSAGHIETEEAEKLVSSLNESLGGPDIEFHPGVSYRHILILRKNYSKNVKCYPAHNIVGKPVKDFLVAPCGASSKATANLLNSLIFKSRGILSNHYVNLARMRLGRLPANMIWPWGPGCKPDIPTIQARYGLKAAVISAVDIVKGIGICSGMDVVNVPGATGFLDTNYEGKAEYAAEALKRHDIVLVHVEAPDEAGHIGDPWLKVKTIEDLDKRLLSRLMEKVEGEFTISVLADHITSTSLKTHTDGLVPFLIFSTAKPRARRRHGFDEASASDSGVCLLKGYRFFDFLINYGKN